AGQEEGSRVPATTTYGSSELVDGCTPGTQLQAQQQERVSSLWKDTWRLRVLEVSREMLEVLQHRAPDQRLPQTSVVCIERSTSSGSGRPGRPRAQARPIVQLLGKCPTVAAFVILMWVGVTVPGMASRGRLGVPARVGEQRRDEPRREDQGEQQAPAPQGPVLPPPPPAHTQAALQAQLEAQQAQAQVPVPQPQDHGGPSIMERFKRMSPPSFKGESDPLSEPTCGGPRCYVLGLRMVLWRLVGTSS
ncbi:hypothetical protein Taro_003733, partial [Colocasia esculenta]|nr:hypothetical protein [Colocasia esculenta]